MIHFQQFQKRLIVLSAFMFMFGVAYGQEDIADIQSLIFQLKSGNAQSQIRAAKELGRLGDKQALEPLIACLNDTSIRNPFIKSTAVEALGQIGDSRAVEPLIACLNDTSIRDPSIKNTVVEALGKIGDPRAVEALITCLKSKERFLHGPSIEALGKIGDHRATKSLSEFLIGDHRISPDIEAALKALGELGDPNAVDAIMTFLKNDDVFEPTRKVAIDTMMKLNSRSGIANLIELWKNSDSWSRRDLSQDLIKAGESAVGPLINILKDSNIQPNDNIRSSTQYRSDLNNRELYTETIEILGQIGDPEVVEVIIIHLESRDYSIREASRQALIKLDTAAVDPLIQFLRKRVPENDRFTASRTRDTAIEILGEIADPNAVDILIRCLAIDDYSEKKAAAKALEQIGDPRAIPHLRKLLQDDNRDISKTAADALANLNYEPKNNAQNITYLISQQNWSQLAKMGKPAVARLIECLDNQDSRIASGACDALVGIGEPAVIPLIAYLKRNMPAKPQNIPQRNRRRRLSSRRRPFRSISPIETRSNIFQLNYVIEILGEIGDPRAVEPLLEYMKYSGKSCPPAVATALGQLGDSRAIDPLIARLDQTYLGAASALALTELLGEKALEHVVPLLPQWGAYDELIFAISRLGWRPRTEAEYVYVWASTNNRGELLTNWEQTKRVLLPDLKNEYKNQRAISVFLELKKDDSAVVSSLLNLLNSRGPTSESLANTYLNCGHARLIDAAAIWLVNKGYKVSYNVWTKDKYGNTTSSTSYDKETTSPDVWQKILRENHTWIK